MTIAAIETRYAGCRFRSRLEARWAVFFDHLGIRWEYEPQGMNVTHRLTLDEGTFPYLPDFFLPDHGLWAEVKGALSRIETVRLLNAAASLSSNNGGGCHDSGGFDVLVLGPVPRPHAGLSPLVLHMYKGNLDARPWLSPSERRCGGIPIAADYGGNGDDIVTGVGMTMEQVTGLLLGGLPAYSDLADLAYAAARSARFEHGACG